MFITTKDQTRLFCNDWGKGRPIVLVHGWPLSSDMWEYQATSLVLAGFRVIAYDRRGFGRSEQPWDGYDYDTLTDDLAAVLEQREVDNAVLVGFSMGGGEVARYLTRHPGARVSKIALVSAVTPFLMKTDTNPDGVDGSVFEDMLKGLETDRPAFLKDFGKKFFGVGTLKSPVSNEMLEWSSLVALQGSARATRECARSFAGTDFRADLKAIKVPTLIIHGDADVTVPIDKSARPTEHFVSGAILKEYKGAPHGLFATNRADLTNDLREFSR